MRHTRTACSGHAAKNGFVLHRIFVLLTLIGSHSMFAYHFFFFRHVFVRHNFFCHEHVGERTSQCWSQYSMWYVHWAVFGMIILDTVIDHDNDNNDLPSWCETNLHGFINGIGKYRYTKSENKSLDTSAANGFSAYATRKFIYLQCLIWFALIILISTVVSRVYFCYMSSHHHQTLVTLTSFLSLILCSRLTFANWCDSNN